MTQIIGQKKLYDPQHKVLINKSQAVGAVVLTIKAGIESVADDRWRAWYAPVMRNGASGKEDLTYLTAPPGGLTIERAKAIAMAAANMQNIAVDAALAQVTEDALKAVKAQQEIDQAVGNA